MLELNNFDTDDFLKNYWQQKPLLIRQALPGFDNPVTPEELAGLACEEDVESRIIIEDSANWLLKQGPFGEQDFLSLNAQHWTLLVQAVDHWFVQVRQLLEYFRFIPSWRIDDVMTSYATQGGNAGPHFDAFSVFLVQGLGKRRWQIGPQCNAKDKRQDNNQLQLLADFQCLQEWTVEPGDVLYLPPGCAHWGIAETEHCMTYSVGFRAPSYTEILSHFCDHQIYHLNDTQRYSDPGLSKQQYPAEITESAIQNIQNILNDLVNDTEQIRQWFGSHITEPKYPSIEHNIINEPGFDEIKNKVLERGQIFRAPHVRFAFTRSNNGGILFANGTSYPVGESAMALIELLTSHEQLPGSDVLERVTCPQSSQLLTTLFNQGLLYCEQPLFD